MSGNLPDYQNLKEQHRFHPEMSTLIKFDNVYPGGTRQLRIFHISGMAQKGRNAYAEISIATATATIAQNSLLSATLRHKIV